MRRNGYTALSDVTMLRFERDRESPSAYLEDARWLFWTGLTALAAALGLVVRAAWTSLQRRVVGAR